MHKQLSQVNIVSLIDDCAVDIAVSSGVLYVVDGLCTSTWSTSSLGIRHLNIVTLTNIFEVCGTTKGGAMHSAKDFSTIGVVFALACHCIILCQGSFTIWL